MTTKALAKAPRPRRNRRKVGDKVRAATATELARRQKTTSIHSFIDVFRAEPLTRVGMIREGLPADYRDELSRRMNMPKERLLPALGIAPATVSRKVREAKPLSSDDSERVLGMARLVGQVQAMVEESGEPEGFNAAEWVAQWLDEPLPALGGGRAADLLDTAEGQAIVSNLLARMQTGAYG